MNRACARIKFGLMPIGFGGTIALADFDRLTHRHGNRDIGRSLCLGDS